MRPSTSTEVDAGRLAAGLPRRRRRLRDQGRPARSDLGADRLRRARDDQRRALQPLRRPVRAGARHPRAHATCDAIRAVVVNSGNANAATGGRGSTTRRRCRARPRSSRGVSEDAGRRRLDRRDRRAAADGQRSPRGIAAAGARAARRRAS